MPAGIERETNTIIASLPGKEGHRFIGLCARLVLSPGDILCESHRPMQMAYFPTSGIISHGTGLGSRPSLELGLIGHDGMLGATLALGVGATPMRAMVQAGGTALVMPASQLRQELHASPRLLKAVHHYQFRLMMQTLQTAACLHFHEIEPRLARWLLMAHDLSLADNVRFTHTRLAHALGVRRSGVTLAAGSLQRQGLIRYSRGDIQILDRAGLETAACECHSALAENYRLVFG